MKKILLAILFLAFCSLGWADTHTVTNPCTPTTVQTAVNAASSGDTVYLNCTGGTWVSGVTINKGITIYGNGDSTVINASGVMAFNIALPSTEDFRMHSLSFTGSGGWTGMASAIINLKGLNNTVWKSLRLDHLKFTNVSTFCIVSASWDQLYSHPKALFDHITYTNTGNHPAFKFAGNNSTWLEADQYGTDYAYYIEDSSFSWSTPNFNNYVVDTEYGVRMVWRYNTFLNGSIQEHDFGSTPASKGSRMTEVYGNTFTNNGAQDSMWTAVALRGGSFLVYNNTISSKYQSPGAYQVFREGGAGYIGHACDGTAVRICNTKNYYRCSGSPSIECYYSGDYCASGTCIVATCTQDSDCPIGTDGTRTCLASIDNVDDGVIGGNGYPCRYQTGWGQEYSTGGRLQYPSPTYWYNNGTDATCATGGACTNAVYISNASASYFAQNRDFCYSTPGTACGSKAAWTYTPYTYPHPMQSYGGSTDTYSPVVTILSPTSSDRWSQQSNTIGLGGTATDNVGVTAVTWSNSVGGSGSCTGTTTWVCSPVTLIDAGDNVVTISASDAAGNTGTDSVTIIYPGTDIQHGHSIYIH